MKPALVLAASLLALAIPDARAADPSPDLIKQAAATAGGTVTVESTQYDATNNDLAKGFNDTFGKDGLHLRVVRYQTNQQVALYEQELRAGKVSTDLLLFSDPSLFLKLSRENKLTPYCSPNFHDYRPEALGQNCTSFALLTYLQYIAYNTDQVKGKDIPTSWNDLLDPKWKGKVTLLDPKIGGGAYYWVYTIYKLFGPDWFVKARANDPLLVVSHGVTENQVMAGERLLGVDISVLTRADGHFPGGKNAPIMEAFPKEGVALLTASTAITLHGPNPAGAKLFIDWASSLAGQKQINHNGLFSLRKDFTNREGDDFSKIKYLAYDPDDMDQHRDAWTAESIKLLSGK